MTYQFQNPSVQSLGSWVWYVWTYIEQSVCTCLYARHLYCVLKKVLLKPLHAFMTFDEVSFSFALSSESKSSCRSKWNCFYKFYYIRTKVGFYIVDFIGECWLFGLQSYILFCTIWTWPKHKHKHTQHIGSLSKTYMNTSSRSHLSIKNFPMFLSSKKPSPTSKHTPIIHW